MHYRHTQVGPAFLRFGTLLVLLVAGTVSAAADAWSGVAIVVVTGAIVLAAVFMFSRFTVEITDDALRASFGRGWPRRDLQWEAAARVRIVHNRWWYGFGIHWFPGGMLWNVWGLDAVEFELVKGGKLRIGTDEPDALLAALIGRVAIG